MIQVEVKTSQVTRCRQICVDKKFDKNRIDKVLSTYETEKKYKGMEEYEWSTAMNRKEKIQFKDQERREAQRTARM